MLIPVSSLSGMIRMNVPMVVAHHVHNTLLGGIKEKIDWLKKIVKLRFRYTNQDKLKNLLGI
jgi:hypothetical protein